MSDLFSSVPDQLLNGALSSQEAVEWLAFGPPEQNARTGLSLDRQIMALHTAAKAFLLSLYGGDLPAFVQSPANRTWYRVPARYWAPQPQDFAYRYWCPRPEDFAALIDAANIPETLLGHPKPLDPRYGFNVRSYPHDLPASDLVGAFIVFRRAEVERHCTIAGPVFRWATETAQQDATSAPIAPPPPAKVRKGAAGRPEGTSNYPGDANVVRKVIVACDALPSIGPGAITREIQKLIREIEGGAISDATKIKRVRNKVLKERPDLGN